MKKAVIFALIVVLTAAATVWAAGKVVTDPNNRPLPYHSPLPASATSTTTTTTKGVLATILTTGYSTLCWTAADNANAAKRVRRFLNSNTASMASSGECIGLNSNITQVVLKPYSAASATYRVDYDLQSGGKTP